MILHLHELTVTLVTVLVVSTSASVLYVDGGRILVTNGIYQTGGPALHGSLTNWVAVTKPVTVESVNSPAGAVIQGNSPVGDGAGRCVHLMNNAPPVVFRLTNGAKRSAGDCYYVRSGGAVLCESAASAVSGMQVPLVNSAVMSNCVLVANPPGTDAFGGSGGGVEGGTLYHCLLIGNHASVEGGGADGKVSRYAAPRSSPVALGSRFSKSRTSGTDRQNCSTNVRSRNIATMFL